MSERNEILSQPIKCDWCYPKPKLKNIRDGIGIFDDSDMHSHFDYPGIPICGGCGGLGHKFDTEDFKERTKQIGKLRSKFHPNDGLPEPPLPVIYYSLAGIVTGVKSLVETYGRGVEGSFASIIADGAYDQMVASLGTEIQESINQIKGVTEVENNYEFSQKEAMLALYEGRFEEGLSLWQELVKKHSDSSQMSYDLGVVFINFFRDANNALECFVRATDLEPKKTMHFFATALLFSLMGKPFEGIPFLERAQLQPDYDDHENLNIPTVLIALYALKEMHKDG